MIGSVWTKQQRLGSRVICDMASPERGSVVGVGTELFPGKGSGSQAGRIMVIDYTRSSAQMLEFSSEVYSTGPQRCFSLHGLLLKPLLNSH